MKQKNTKLLIIAAVFCSVMINFSTVRAQEEIKMSKEDSIGNVLLGVKNDVDFLKKLKITGYVQAQWQKADTAGAPGFEGGNFPGASDQRFKVRRGRIKLLYGDDYNQFVMQFDVSEGGFATKDIYAKLTEPFLNTFSITGGVFNRPFGYEIAYSSKDRESPERARFTQTLFPGERDLGAQFSFNPPKTSRFNFIHLDAGLFAGNGVNPEFDKKKDFIGHLWISKATKSEKIKFGLGVSMYNGYVLQSTKYVYKMDDVEGGVQGFKVDSTSANKNDFATRQYFGADAQFSVETPVGLSTLRGEYVFGQQPGTCNDAAKSNYSTTSPTIIPTGDTYIRNFNAFYVYFVQNILKSKHQIVVKYDVYDPNTDISGTDIATKISGTTTKLSSADVKYTTIGLGYIYHFNNNLKFTFYYDIVTNESTSIAGTGFKDFRTDQKDNVFTVRMQYKF